MILAGIDIGTNTIRLLVAETGDSTHREIHSGRTITRLGQDLDRTGRLAPEAQERSLIALQEFAAIIRKHDVVASSIVGTSALRNASNAGEFISAVKQRTGLDIKVVSGDDEAQFTLLGVRRALSPVNRHDADPLASAVVIDIGGGSTEIIFTCDGSIASMQSLSLGAVYLTERFVRHDPTTIEEMDDIRGCIVQELDALSSAMTRPGLPMTCVGTAGSITTLAAMDQGLSEYDPDRINGYVLQKTALDRIIGVLATSTLRQRKLIAGLEPGREDIILAGAMIAQEIMARCRAQEMLVSDWGLREGVVFDLSERLKDTRQ